MLKKSLLPVLLLLITVVVIGPAFGQDAKPIYTQVGFWDVPRAKWAEFERHFEKYEKPVYERLLAEGLILEWGFESNGLHHPDGYSHAQWVSAHSIANLEKALDAYYQSLGADAEKVEAEFAAMVSKHRDYIAESDFFATRPVKLTSGYTVGTYQVVRPRRYQEFRRSWETRVKPIYDKLLADKTIVAYSMGGESFHTEMPRGVWTWYVIDNIDALEKVDAAFDAEWDKLSQADRDAWMDQRMDLVDFDAHRDAFTRLIHYQTR